MICEWIQTATWCDARTSSIRFPASLRWQHHRRRRSETGGEMEKGAAVRATAEMSDVTD
jgi:hypothetical protein